MAKYTVKKGKRNYKGTKGDDVFTTGAKVGIFDIYAKGGNDKIYIARGNGEYVNVGEGNDFVQVTGGKVARITLSAGKNTINVTGGQVNKIESDGYYSKKQNDVINVTGQKNIKILTGDGTDRVTVTGIDNDYLSKVSRARITTRDGNDVITINKGGYNRIEAGAGKDTITINAGSNYVNGGNGVDTIVVNSKKGNCIYGGDGADKITIGKNSQRCVVFGGDGQDTITVKSTYGGKTGVWVNGGRGGDTINVHYANNTIVVDARSDWDSHDKLKIYADDSALGSMKYYKKNDVMVINGNAHILGFSTLTKITTVTPFWGSYEFTAKGLINDYAQVVNKAFDISGLWKEYNSIKSLASIAPSTTGSTWQHTAAKIMGYKGLYK
jgi:Ca2+-binding RTX toxin-like protein